MFSATLAVGKLLGLNAQRLADALGVSGSFAAGTMEFLARVTHHLEVLEVTPLRRFASGDMVVVVLSGRWRARATGREVLAEVVNIFTLRGDCVAAYQVFHDTAALWEALRGESLPDAG